jgi:hypothetical protein
MNRAAVIGAPVPGRETVADGRAVTETFDEHDTAVEALRLAWAA